MFLEAIASRRVRLALAGISPEKASIFNLSKSWPNDSIEVSFNPATIQFSAASKYEEVEVPDSKEGVRLNYVGNTSKKLIMTLLFDTTITGDDVREKYINFLIELTVPVQKTSSDLPQPPLCRFEWGDFSKDFAAFDAVLCDLTVDYKWFLPNGRPVRAECSVTFTQPDKPTSGTNPTSRSEARRVWTVIEGQSLAWIAYQEYGDSSAWRHIARVNNLPHPRDLRAGQVLKLVPLP